MANHSYRKINYTPRMDCWQALEAMPPRLRAFMNESWFVWNCYAVLRHYRKLAQRHPEDTAVNSTIAWVESANHAEALKPWKFMGRTISSPLAWQRARTTTLADLLGPG